MSKLINWLTVILFWFVYELFNFHVSAETYQRKFYRAGDEEWQYQLFFI